MEDFEHESGLFACENRGAVAVLKFKRPVRRFAEDPGATEALFSCISRIERRKDTKALALIYGRNALAESHYSELLSRLKKREDREVRPGLEKDILRAEHGFHRFILTALNFDKILIGCFQGQVASTFLGVLLATDIRIASVTTEVQMSHVDLGIPPDGGLAFFLPQFVGRGRSTEILLSGEPLSAEDLLDLGLVSALVGEENFGEDCLLIAERFLKGRAAGIPFTKQALRLPWIVVKRHLEGEYLNMKRALHQL
jgi:enoyl-CoA hydratase/carnithine racemase